METLYYLKSLNQQIVITFFALLMTTSVLGQIQINDDIDGAFEGDRAGRSVSISADGLIVAVGSFSNNENGEDSGHVRIFRNVNDVWVQLGQSIVGVNEGDWAGYSVSLSPDGVRVAIGAHRYSEVAYQAGHVRIFEYSNEIWTQIGNDIHGEALGDQSGFVVSMSGDGSRVAIGAPKNESVGVQSGQVRIYEYSNENWTQIGNDIDGENANDQSGSAISLSLDGSKVIVGAILNDGNGLNSGHARVFEYLNGDWIQMGSDIDGEATNDFFGRSVSISQDGTFVIIGADNNDGNGSNAGHARVYSFDGSDWSQVGNDIDGEAAGDFSGFHVSINSDATLIGIGARSNDGNGTSSGQTRVYEFLGDDWSQKGDDIDGEDAFDESGFSISFSKSGTTIAIGSPNNDGNGSGAGHVRVYDLSDPVPPVSVDPVFTIGDEKSVQVHPNPNNGHFTLSYENKNKEDAFIQIFGTDGVLILSKTIKPAPNDIYTEEVFNLPQGKMYFVVLQIREEVIAKRVLALESK